jgi:hypothetical protein
MHLRNPLLMMVAGIILANPARLPAQVAGAGTVQAGQTTITLPDTSAYSPAERYLLALEIERSGAIARHDTAWLARLYAPDFQGIVAGGQRVDQAALLNIFTRDAPDSRFAIDELVIRSFTDAATVTGRLRTNNAAGNQVGESRYLHAYVRRGNQWWIVAAAGSAVASGR